MRVAMLGWEFPPFVSGGLGVHCYELTSALCRQGVEIDFFMPVSGKKIVSPFFGMRIIEVAKSVLRPYLSFSKVPGKPASYGKNLVSAVEEYSDRCIGSVLEEHQNNSYDLIHSHDWLTALPGLELGDSLSIPQVQTFHSTEYDRTSWPWDYVLDIERKAAVESDLIIAVSNRARTQVIRLGAKDDRVRVVYNGIDKKKFSSSCVDPEVMRKFQKSGFSASDSLELEAQGRKIVLFLGRLTEQKGPVQFLHAAKKVLSVDKDVLFLVVGKGELLPLLINMSIELGISKNVRFLGYVPDEDQKRVYKLADVYVMPSTSEPFGITALEAMSSEVPVIISKTSGVAEIVSSALKVDFWDINAMAEKILAVLRYRPLAKAMSRLGSCEAEQYSWERTAGETLKVYNEALSRYPKKV